MLKKTKIVCTIGPASDSVETLKTLMQSGMNVCRLNFSHGSTFTKNKKHKTSKRRIGYANSYNVGYKRSRN